MHPISNLHGNQTATFYRIYTLKKLQTSQFNEYLPLFLLV
jgi:hypothetical protein